MRTMQAEEASAAPRLTRPRSPRSEAGTETGTDSRWKINDWVTWGVLGVCLGAWAVVGFFLWVPRVLKAILLFSVSLVQVTVTDSSADDAGQRLRRAAEFYTRGFARAVGGIRSSGEGAAQENRGASDPGWQIESRLILRELAWAMIVWYAIACLLGAPVLTPVELFVWLAEIPWSQAWTSIVQTARSIPLPFLDGVFTG